MNIRVSFLKALAVGSAIALMSGSLIAFAQGVPSTIDGMTLTPSVMSPNPGQSVTITAKSYTVDINSADITWTVGGKATDKGMGVTQTTVKAPALGKTLTVEASAVMPDGSSLKSSVSITSGSIDLIVEPDGYVPPMWSGKINPTYQNSVKIVAMPHIANSAGVEYDPKSLVYKWQQNGSAMEGQSGYGRQSITIPGAMIPRPYVMTVTVSTSNGSAQTMGIAPVDLGTAFIGFYKNDPLYGPLYNNAIGDTLYLGSQRETAVIAVPYGFNIPAAGLGDLALTWLINGTERPELAMNRSITLRAPDASAGSSNIQLMVKNNNLILQSANSSFGVVFSASATTSQAAF